MNSKLSFHCFRGFTDESEEISRNRDSSRSPLWDRYWGQDELSSFVLFPVRVPQATACEGEQPRPIFLLASKMALAVSGNEQKQILGKIFSANNDAQCNPLV